MVAFPRSYKSIKAAVDDAPQQVQAIDSTVVFTFVASSKSYNISKLPHDTTVTISTCDGSGKILT